MQKPSTLSLSVMAVLANLFRTRRKGLRLVHGWRYFMAMQVTLEKDFRFESAHFLPNVPDDHKCRRIHGHSYLVTICVTGDVDSHSGWYLDHSDISKAMNPIVASLDHKCLNDIEGLGNPTFEMLAAWIWNKLKPCLSGLSRIIIHETAGARCIYSGD